METVTKIGIILAQLCAVSLLVVIDSIIFRKGLHFYEDLRGPDKQWQPLELSIVLWCLVFPHIVVCDILGLDVPNAVWTSMNSVFLMSVGAKVVRDKLAQPQQPPP